MRKFLAFTLAFVLTLSLVSCGSNEAVQAGPVFPIENDAYACTPDEFVLVLREMIDRVEGVSFTPREIPLPSEAKPDATKYYRLPIVPRQLIMEIDANDDGYVTGFNLEWTSTTEANNNAALIIFAVVHMLMPSNADEILDDFNLAVIDETLCDATSDGTSFLFFGKATEKFYLKVYPASISDSN